MLGELGSGSDRVRCCAAAESLELSLYMIASASAVGSLQFGAVDCLDVVGCIDRVHVVDAKCRERKTMFGRHNISERCSELTHNSGPHVSLIARPWSALI